MLKALILFLFLASCGDNAGRKERLCVALDTSSITSLDPAETYETLSIEIILNTYQRLFRKTCDSQLKTDLVERYEFLQGGKLLRLHLRRGQKFSSKRPVTAEDVEYSLQRVVFLQKRASCMLLPLGFTPKNVKRSIRYIDQYTVELLLPKILSEDVVLSCLSTSAAAILDAQAVKKHTVNEDYGNAWLRKNSAGSGPFILGLWHPQELIILKKNPYYSNASNIKITATIMRHVPDSKTRFLLLANGSVDIVIDQAGSFFFESMQKKNKYTCLEYSPGTIWYLNLNQKNKYLAKPEVQQAIRHLLDYPQLVKVFGGGKPLYTLVPEGFCSYMGDYGKPEYNPEKARKLIHESCGGPITLELDMSFLGLGEELKRQFAEADIQLQLCYYQNVQIINRLNDKKHQLALKHFSADYLHPNTFFSIFIDPGKVAERNSFNVDGLKEKVRMALRVDKKEMERIYKDLQVSLLKKPIIFLMQSPACVFASKTVQNLTNAYEQRALQYYALSKEVQ